MSNFIPVQTEYGLHGRRVILASYDEITPENVLACLNNALTVHSKNRSEIDYLWRYYKGDQPILERVKDVRPEINNKIVANRANEIVSFKVGYLCGEPIQYVAHTGDDAIAEKIMTLNNLMFSEDKSGKDREIVEWQMICGTAFRLILPDPETSEEPDEAPFEMYTLDPRNTFVVYSNDIGHRPLMAVKYIYNDEDNVTVSTIYTDKYVFTVNDYTIADVRPNVCGCIPIFEYPANSARLGSFEIVLPLLDAINTLESNRLDAVEQHVQAFLKFINCDITAEGFEEFRRLGAIKVKSVDGANADVDIVSSELNQDQSQTYMDDLYASVLEICGIPSRSGENASESTTGAGVILRNGWSTAESRAKDSENIFKTSEKKMLKLLLKICRESGVLDIKLSDVDMKFTRRNYEAIQSKSQVLVSMLQNQKIHPLLAFEHCGMFTDPEAAYMMSNDYYEEQMEKWNPVSVEEDVNEEESVQTDGKSEEKDTE